MGVSSKWIKALVGLKKSETNSEKEEKKRRGSKSRHQRKHSFEIETGRVQNNFNYDNDHLGVVNRHPLSNAAGSPSSSSQLEEATHNQLNLTEEQAATRIQTAFRGFLARRALCALRGLVRLQALVRGHAVRKQAAMTLRCMQALVRVQARVRARRVRLALENHGGQEKHTQQLANESLIREIEERWCDSVGSKEQIEVKLLKRKEAAAKRQRAMAYALAHQWQAGSRHQAAAAGFEPDKNSWGWNWLERWMAVRPWENHSFDINLRDGVIIRENSRTMEKKGDTPHFKPTGSQAKSEGAPQSEVNGSSPGKLNVFASSNGSSVKPKSKLVENAREGEANITPAAALRSRSNPKERSTQSDKQAKKRLSLPNNGGSMGDRTSRLSDRSATKVTPRSQKTAKDRSGFTAQAETTNSLPRVIDP